MSEAEKDLQEPQTDEPVEQPSKGEPRDMERDASEKNPTRGHGDGGEDSDDEDSEESDLPIPGMEPEPDERESESQAKEH